MRPRHCFAALGLILALCPPAGSRAADPAPAPAATLGVSVQGWLPGFGEAELPPFIAEQMNAAGITRWRFAPAAANAAQPPNRVEWRFKPNPYAGGPTFHRLGFIREIDQIFGVHRPVTVEVRLYLDGEYQLLESDEPTLQGGTRDTALQKEIGELTRSLASAADPGGTPKS